MAVESAADRASFLSPDDFGETAIYTPAAGGAQDLNGVFDNPSLTVVMSEADSVDAEPTFVCHTADLPAGAAELSGGTLAVAAGTYAVAEVRPDGTGMTVLILAAS